MSASGPTAELSYDPPGPTFAISEECEMPAITVTADLQNVPLDPRRPPQYNWSVTLVFDGANCPHSRNRRIEHPKIKATTLGNSFTIPFTHIRGGALTISVSINAGTVVVTAHRKKLQITGTNPSTATLMKMLIPNEVFKKLMRVESGLRQFRSQGCPLFSNDNLGGVGVCQITVPRPTDDQVWSWKANLKAGLRFYKGKEDAARKHPQHVRDSQKFKALVKAYNDGRVADSTPEAPLKALIIDLPDYTPEQLERDTVRGYNGYAGGVHEYRVKVDDDGGLVVNVNSDGTRGTAEWEAVSAADRINEYDRQGIAANHRGDPNYVEDVYGQAGF